MTKASGRKAHSNGADFEKYLEDVVFAYTSHGAMTNEEHICEAGYVSHCDPDQCQE